MRASNDAVTHERLVEILNYDPETGIFTSRISVGPRKAGTSAGSLCNRGYLRIEICGHRYGAHRLAWFYVHGKWPNYIDHIDGDKINNRISNLRDVSIAENSQNMKLGRRNRTGIHGVWWSTKYGVWVARIGVHGKKHDLGRFPCLLDAVAVRKRAEREFGYHPNHGRDANNGAEK